MANINQVKHWLRAGKKVARPTWKENSYWTLSADGYGRILYSDGTAASIHLKQLEEIDWEIYKEKIIVADILIDITKAGYKENDYEKGYGNMMNKISDIINKIGVKKIKW